MRDTGQRNIVIPGRTETMLDSFVKDLGEGKR